LDWNAAKTIFQLCFIAFQLSGHWFDVALCNIYRNGSDYVSFHNDKDSLDTAVGSFSFGAPRRFIITKQVKSPILVRHHITEEILASRSFFLMKPGFQRKYFHAIAKIGSSKDSIKAKETGQRINLTLRQHNTELCDYMKRYGPEFFSILSPKFLECGFSIVLQYLFWKPDVVVS
jgi:alkylated DNA repair dioxygenase AlkB